MSITLKFPTEVASGIPDDITCTICNISKANCLTACNHTACYSCLLKWKKTKKVDFSCHMCRSTNVEPLKYIGKTKPFIFKSSKTDDIPNYQEIKFTGTLLPFQSEALEWMTKENKGILSFDMGMGKTITSIAHLSMMSPYVERTLIIVPLGLINQWRDSLLLFTNLKEKDIFIYYGKEKKDFNLLLYNLRNPRIFLTNIESIYKNDIIKNIRYNYVIVDEAHNFRNDKTTKHQFLHYLMTFQTRQIKYKWLLTGTPIHNKIEDVYSILSLITTDEMLSKYYYRKLKSDVKIELPQKIIHNCELSMYREHQILYNEIHKETRKFIIRGLSATKFSCVLEKILRLLQLCNHPDNTILPDKDSLSTNSSVKYTKILEIVNGIPPNDKIIIFSRWNTTISSIKTYLRVNGHDSLEYTGQYNKVDKDNTIHKFKTNSSNRILLINILAGGCGLNLVCAKHMIIVEPAWTYSIIDQAINRIHRIGQTSDVNIYLLRTLDTIETWIHNLVNEKKILSEEFDNGLIYSMNKGLLQDLLQKFVRAPIPISIDIGSSQP